MAKQNNNDSNESSGIGGILGIAAALIMKQQMPPGKVAAKLGIKGEDEVKLHEMVNSELTGQFEFDHDSNEWREKPQPIWRRRSH
jgi:hypothetical protein